MPGTTFSQSFEETGRCSYYADKFQGRNTTSGDKYDRGSYTGAHRTLPFGTKVEVTNLSNNKKVVVKINDRGPATKSRIIDISSAAAEDLGIIPMGVVKVSIRVTDADIPSPKKYDDPVKPALAGAGGKGVIKDKSLIYDHDMNVCFPEGYGVAAGYYQNRENCTKALQVFEERYKAPGFIIETKKKNVVSYILVLGCVSAKKNAAALLQLVKKDIPDAHVVSFSNL